MPNGEDKTITLPGILTQNTQISGNPIWMCKASCDWNASHFVLEDLAVGFTGAFDNVNLLCFLWEPVWYKRAIKPSFNRVFPKCFIEFSDKNIFHYSTRAQSCHLLCKRIGCYYRTSKTDVRDNIFKLSLIYALVINQIPWIHWIQWKFCFI